MKAHPHRGPSRDQAMLVSLDRRPRRLGQAHAIGPAADYPAQQGDAVGRFECRLLTETVSFGSARPGGGVVYRGGFRLPRKGFGGAPSPGGSHGMSAEAAVASTPPRAPRPGTVGGTRPEVDQYQYQQAVDVKLPTLAHTPTQ